MKTTTPFLLFAGLLLAGCTSPNVVIHDETHGGVTLPSGNKRLIVSTVAPKYPAELRKDNITGVVVVRIWVRADGSIANAVAQSSPHPALARAAEQALLRWQFERTSAEPSKLMVLQLPITFDLQEDTVSK